MKKYKYQPDVDIIKNVYYFYFPFVLSRSTPFLSPRQSEPCQHSDYTDVDTYLLFDW